MRWWFLGLMACSETVIREVPDTYEGDGEGECGDDADNDRDGLFDCDDDGCAGAEACVPDTDVETDPPEVDPTETDPEETDAGGDDTDVVDTDVVDTDVVDTDVVDTDVVDTDVDTDVVDTDPPILPATFTTPGAFDVVVPAGVTSVTVHLWGGGGAGGNQAGASGGGGAYVSAMLAVTPGEVLTVNVGDGADNTGDGAGASSVWRGAAALAVAGGGGGGGSDGNSGNSFGGGAGGAGGGLQGQDGQGLTQLPGYAFCTAANGGQGGGQAAGGAGGTFTGTGPYACVGQGGGPMAGGASSGSWGNCNVGGAFGWMAGGGQSNGGGGGGGAGWFGGGGAGFIWTYCGGGGGGGSSFVDPGASAIVVQPGSGRAQGNPAASGGAGRGGERAYNQATLSYDPAFGQGSDGRVELVW